MNWRFTWMLVGLAGALLAFIMLVERRLRPSYELGEPPARLFNFKAAEVTNVQLRITNQLALRAERDPSGESWSLTIPFPYPAQGPAIDWLLHSLEELAPPTFIAQRELTYGRRTLADYGLDVPPFTLTLFHGGQRTEILFGGRTPIGDQVYLQLLDRPGAYLVPAELFDRLPRNPNDWRDNMVFSTLRRFTRLDVRTAGRGYSVELTNQQLMVTRPTPARADPVKFSSLLRKIESAQITQFVTDNIRADLEPYGLQPPELEVAFGEGTNDLVVVQFGRAPPNDPSVVYVRRMAQTNIVLASREILDAFQTTFSELRDLHLVALPPNGPDSIEVTGTGSATENFIVRRTTNATWTVGESTSETSVLADNAVMRDWIDRLATLEGTVEKDVVTDFKTLYNLDPPARQYILRMSLTNANGGMSNVVIGVVQLGARQDNKVFARRPDEATVYSLAPSAVARLPYAAWQLRDRRVWTFTTNQVARLTVRHGGASKTILRNANGSWSFAEGSVGIINNAAMEEIMYGLGELRASAWVAQGAERKAQFGFHDTGDQFTIDLRNGDKPRTLVLEFGDPKHPSPSKLPYAMATADGQTFIFEIPPAIYIELLRNLTNQMFPPVP
jgi:hypothetical protein